MVSPILMICHPNSLDFAAIASRQRGTTGEQAPADSSRSRPAAQMEHGTTETSRSMTAPLLTWIVGIAQARGLPQAGFWGGEWQKRLEITSLTVMLNGCPLARHQTLQRNIVLVLGRPWISSQVERSAVTRWSSRAACVLVRELPRPFFKVGVVGRVIISAGHQNPCDAEMLTDPAGFERPRVCRPGGTSTMRGCQSLFSCWSWLLSPCSRGAAR